ncbi:hypothetical protein MBLNU13_g09269t2 [Cladosporium sp. NU13]
MAESETYCEKSITADNETAARKLAIRQPCESAPNLQDDVHIIWVGSPPQVSTIHSALLPTKTLYTLATSQTQPYPGLPIDFYTVDATHETFEIYRSFLYTGKLFTHDAHGDQDYAHNGNDEAHEDREWVRLALTYFLGLKMGDEKFCNAVVDGIVEKMAEADRSPTGLATEVYAHTQPGDKLRALLVDLHVWKGLGTWIQPPHDDANGPMYFRREVRTSVREAGSAIHDADVPMPWEDDPCQYHVHNDTAVCERKESLGESRLEAPFKCEPCDKPFPSASALGGHKASPGHKRKAKNWAAAAAQ